MNKHILTIFLGAMIACSLSSCSKDDEIKVDRIHTTATADKITIEEEVINDNIVIIPEKINAIIGEVTDCGIKAYGEPVLSYSIADEKIATIDKDGKISAKTEGETTITVSFNNKEIGKIKLISNDGLIIDGKTFLPAYAVNFDAVNGYYVFGISDLENDIYGESENSFSMVVKDGKIESILSRIEITKGLDKCSATVDEENKILTFSLDIETDGFVCKGKCTIKYNK